MMSQFLDRLVNEERKYVHQSMIVNKYSLTIVPFFNLMYSSSEFGTANLVEPLIIYILNPYYTVP